MSRARLTVCVLLPFAAGYYLSYLFRTINALIARDLTAELGLSAADLGFLTSVYFLAFAAVQLPLGVLLDRYGPRTIQSILLLVASAGALVFALADGLLGLVIGRALLGFGVALALMAGFKAIVLWFPATEITLTNGWLVMLGALDAVTATAPAELVVQGIGWRGLFAVLGALSALAALLVLFAVPEPSGDRSPSKITKTVDLWTIYRDPRFWRVAPLSAIGIGTSWSLQGLWAAPWLRDVDGLDRASVVQHLSVMAVVVCASALLLGACFVFAITLLTSNPLRGMLQWNGRAGLVLTLEHFGPAREVLLHPATLAGLAVVALIAVALERRQHTAPEFALGAFLGVLSVLTTTLLTGMVLRVASPAWTCAHCWGWGAAK